MVKIAKIAKNGQKMVKIQKSKNIKFWLFFLIYTHFGNNWQGGKPKRFNKWFQLLLAIKWQKVAFYGPKPNETLSNYSKTSYFDIEEVVKHFGQGLGRRSDYGQNSKNGQKWPKNGQHPKVKKNIKCWLIFGIYTHFVANWQGEKTKSLNN